MEIVFTDPEIETLVLERKILSGGWRTVLSYRTKPGHDEWNGKLVGENGNEFHIFTRRNKFNPLNFSIILAVYVPGSYGLFRLRRYNGKSHEHTNKIENETFYDYHIHMATERYQLFRRGHEDAYAKVTDRYSEINGALACLSVDACIEATGQNPAMFPIIPEV